ncbi:FAD dependent oxidoreductase [Naematelia encephala]|uniref:FAD dependent oxidoreductase n=1 Tax=Naematelia encephala TaxID=71784 RepID=A0A1Y2AY09_9TREE|nr:FAD dependent oxidoreductase [Naematelia encephala]
MLSPSSASSPFGKGVLPPEWAPSPWQQSTREDPLVNHGRADPVPQDADVVIIGSGLAGAVTAYHLLSSSSRPRTVVMLEAREACSGASGRNAGHCRPDAFRGYTNYAAFHGPEQASAILASEKMALANATMFVKHHAIECEFTPRPTVDVCLSQDFVGYASSALDSAKLARVDVSSVAKLEGAAAKEVCRSPDCIAAFQWPAATLNPSKLCYAVHRACFSLGGYSLFTHTPVTSVVPGSVSKTWSVKTTRGAIQTAKVIYATNAYTKLLLPEFEGLITPYKVQAVQLSAPPAGPEAFPRIAPSMSLRYGLHQFYSVAQRPDDSVVLCCAVARPGQTMQQFVGAWDVMDDAKPDDARTRDAVDEFNAAIPGGGYDQPASLEPGKGGFDSAWSGIIGFTPDAVPFIGPIPEKEGQYMIAGFNGHGMARIFHCAPCLADVVLGGMELWDETVPRAFVVTKERVEKLRQGVEERDKLA